MEFLSCMAAAHRRTATALHPVVHGIEVRRILGVGFRSNYERDSVVEAPFDAIVALSDARRNASLDPMVLLL